MDNKWLKQRHKEVSTVGQNKSGELKVVNLLRKDQKLLVNDSCQKHQSMLCLVRSMRQALLKKEKIKLQVNSFLNNLKRQLKLPDVTGEHDW